MIENPIAYTEINAVSNYMHMKMITWWLNYGMARIDFVRMIKDNKGNHLRFFSPIFCNVLDFVQFHRRAEENVISVFG